ncbi:MAG: SEL1-like repeat protein [Enterocloster citroniae]|nr:SEL1-like repeat protein [Enterocloster citroniae]
MAKLIFTSRYLKDAPPAQLENYVRYIGTREGVEKIDESKKNLPATVNQKKLIQQLLRDIPETKEMLEYEDYRSRPTTGNASEFISCALEPHLDLAAKRENYVDYISGRPRVERIGEHGLFTDAGRPVVIQQVQDEVKDHKGAVWTHVISLRREDAARLGYDHAAQWMALLRSKRAMLCKHMKIDSENLRWYAAFHNESYHPHVHLLVYSAKDNDGYLTRQSIEAMRSELAHDIFRQDFAHIYEEQNQSRADLKAGAREAMQALMEEIRSGTLENPEIERMMVQLSKRLQNTGGKKVYGYLKRDVKNLIDRIVDELEKDSRVAELYQNWGKWQNEILLTYSGHVPELAPLSQHPQFKSIKNMVIAEALKLGSHHVSFEDENMSEQEEERAESKTETQFPYDELNSGWEEVPDVLLESILADDIRGIRQSESFHADWNEQYKKARNYLYGGADTEQDFKQAFILFKQEAESGNALAMYDLGRMCQDGLGRDADMEKAQEWYGKALTAFQLAVVIADEKKRPYLWYRIGKMYAVGLGTEVDHRSAAEWLSRAVAADHMYAQYSLGGLYYRGQGVSQDYAEAFRLYTRSAEQGNPYAAYELAKMYRDGIGTDKDMARADVYFRKAFAGFKSLEEKSRDDKLQYRLGQMLHTGTGTEKDDNAAAEYWEKSAKLGNIHAQYTLGKLWLEHGNGNPDKAVRWIAKAADAGNATAQYALGKIYRDGEYLQKDMKRAVELFTLSAEQGNEYAAYQLGKLYLSGEDVPADAAKAVSWLLKAAEQEHEYAFYQLGKLYLLGEHVPKDVDTAVRYLTASAEKGNQYAEYALGKLYLCGHDVPRDKEKAFPFLQASAAQGNIYAQFLLDHLDSFQEPSVFLAATRLLHRLENLFREEYWKGNGGEAFRIDRKRQRRLAEKKQAQGQKGNDQEPTQKLY